ncbi:MAG: lipoprotein [Spiroplasma phoeniceum]|nr:MAG: lipoprotein [Spiroplasma phoeniceum]UZQ31530.1 MAG: lipoprotein [Spiroplasma phoeniceum]
MKKLLNILGIFGLISTPVGSLTACSGNKKLKYL